MTQQNFENRISLWVNDNLEGKDNAPDLTGRVNIGGTDYNVNVWFQCGPPNAPDLDIKHAALESTARIRAIQGNRPVISGSVYRPRKAQGAASVGAPPASGHNDPEGDIPF